MEKEEGNGGAHHYDDDGRAMMSAEAVQDTIDQRNGVKHDVHHGNGCNEGPKYDDQGIKENLRHQEQKQRIPL